MSKRYSIPARQVCQPSLLIRLHQCKSHFLACDGGFSSFWAKSACAVRPQADHPVDRHAAPELCTRSSANSASSSCSRAAVSRWRSSDGCLICSGAERASSVLKIRGDPPAEAAQGAQRVGPRVAVGFVVAAGDHGDDGVDRRPGSPS